MAVKDKLDEKLSKTIEEICRHRDRTACSKGEKETADYIAQNFEKLGLKTEVQRFRTIPMQAWSVMLHLVCLLAAAALIPSVPVLALTLILLAGISFAGEMNSRWYWLRNLLSTGISQNTLGHLAPEKFKRTVIVCASLDSPRESCLNKPSISHLLWTPASRMNIYRSGLLLVIYFSILALVFAFDGSGSLLALFAYLGVLFLAIALILTADWLFGKPTPGASSASGVAGMLDLAERLLKDKQQDTEYYFIACGASQSAHSGAYYFLREFGHRLDPMTSFVINLGPSGTGKLHYVDEIAHGGFFRMGNPEPEMLMRASDIVRREKKFNNVDSTSDRWLGNALVFSEAGFASIGLLCLNSYGMPDNYGWRSDTPEKLTYEESDRLLDFAQRLIDKI